MKLAWNLSCGLAGAGIVSAFRLDLFLGLSLIGLLGMGFVLMITKIHID